LDVVVLAGNADACPALVIGSFALCVGAVQHVHGLVLPAVPSAADRACSGFVRGHHPFSHRISAETAASHAGLVGSGVVYGLILTHG
jgi:hypothetical protein